MTLKRSVRTIASKDIESRHQGQGGEDLGKRQRCCESTQVDLAIGCFLASNFWLISWVGVGSMGRVAQFDNDGLSPWYVMIFRFCVGLARP